MKISVFSRREIENMLPQIESIAKTCNFISINNVMHFAEPPIFTESPIPEKYRNQTLILHFDDASSLDKNSDSRFLFDKAKALQIRDFTRLTLTQKRDLIIHCHAGVSRSGAIGIVLNDYANRVLQNNPEDFKQFYNSFFYPRLAPNMNVALTLMRELEMV